MKKQYKKIVLAYSGGLDTSVLIPWLKENYGAEIIAVSGNVGQASELEGLEEKALKTGASKLYIEDLQEEFVNDYVIPTVKAGAAYEKYLLGTSFARPIIAKRIVEIAKKEGADAICHGCTGKGNDQVRFELAIKAFAPEMDIIAPWRFWELNSREKEIEYAEKHNIPLKINKETNYSKDKNLWHLSHEGLDLEDPANEAPIQKPGFLELGVSPYDAPDTPTKISLHFEKGIPVSLNGEEMKPLDIILKLNELGGANGIGLLDVVENRLVGMKSRGVYETPGGTILYAAHEKLEEITLDKETAHYKQQVALKFADLVYNGQWYTPLRKALSAFVDSTQETVTGDVTLKLYKGNIIPCSVTSPFSLYSSGMATFDEDDCYNQSDSEGFINLFGLPLKVRALNDKELFEKEGIHFPSVE
ncbi:MAG: argininosuccinate synthase [Floccifex porci]|uniref:Argininosuccinate synthase n=1 Tax=Floccifex porci TaxID=2606629 RepID=A0A7X2N3M1_9FIRM|nr:argininosuccinate synthase [Floccifex porci]MCI7802693.1 argininosuccinate synthase [Erysipelotrichaceae bacterium]MDD7467002.1 argininosuccinate synthase [Floccifex porci]MDO4479571.1 argininosuccinate synthase [Erysipelotrichaceae bacterium]MDY4797565.1 argininosuccinate synthase [Floccifex porci]MSS01826.1 argininosuccinate synthase [Floccifex porci]